MSGDPAVTEEKTRGRGRPRDGDVRKRILASAVCLLEKKSFAEITTDAIAEHSGAGKATIYRWWPDKAAVLIDAFRESVARELPFPHTGSLKEDLRRQLRQFSAIVQGSRGRIFSGFIAAAQTDPDVLDAFRQMWITPRRAETKAALEVYRSKGDLPPDIDLDCVVEMLFGPLYYRMLFRWESITGKYLEKLLNTAMEGLTPRTLPEQREWNGRGGAKLIASE